MFSHNRTFKLSRKYVNRLTESQSAALLSANGCATNQVICRVFATLVWTSVYRVAHILLRGRPHSEMCAIDQYC
jgi:hypothetical protein